MRGVLLMLVLGMAAAACDEGRVFEQNHDFENRLWLSTEQPEFEFEIADSVKQYNLYLNLRNAVSFPYARVFVNSYLLDSSGRELNKKLNEAFLFDQKTGKPFGQSGLGDIYDHQIAVLSKHRFPYSGKFRMKFEQYMRTDSLQGVLAVGLRVEKAYLEK